MTAVRKPLPSRGAFLARLGRGVVVGGGVVAVSLGIGVLGYHGLAGLPWIDALLNAAMILTGMGPVDAITTTRGKLFATCYALFSGIAFLSVVAVVFGPVLHRFLHRFHLELASGDDAQATAERDPTVRTASSTRRQLAHRGASSRARLVSGRAWW